MKVLWFEVTTPSGYQDDGMVVCGWQDSLERIVKTCPEIQLTVAFEGNRTAYEKKCVDGVNYVPMVLQYSLLDKLRNYWTWEPSAILLEEEMQKVVSEVAPDLIHVFGTEWPFGRIAKFTKVPVVVHIMGSMVPYNNAYYPPFYSIWDHIRQVWWNPKSILRYLFEWNKTQTREQSEIQVWQNVVHYMGRTEWDENLSSVLHPGRKYYHVDEALRQFFLQDGLEWRALSECKLKLVSTGCSTYWKGPDMMLKTAKILLSLGVDFSWVVAGFMCKDIRIAVERKEGTTFKDNNINILGYTQPEQLSKILSESTIYVHTAYIENSPNAICEAQCIGVPVVSTNVGGIASLVKDKEQGVLVPANDPWQMAAAIINLAKDIVRMKQYSDASKRCARNRHNPEIIKQQLLSCYSDVLKSCEEVC